MASALEHGLEWAEGQRMGERIDGRALALARQRALEAALAALRPERPPAIVSFCNVDHADSVKYTAMKAKKAAELDIHFITENYVKLTRREHLAARIQGYNRQDDIDGIMVQLPLPDHLAVFRDDLLALIDPQKDVDGLSEAGRAIFLPATTRGVFSILDYLEEERGVDLSRLTGVVLGSEGMVGKPLLRNMQGRLTQVVGFDIKNGPIDFAAVERADLVMAATGVENLVTKVKEGAIALDLGLRDIDEAVYPHTSFYTPKVGGLGPMTVISLMENVVASYARRDRGPGG
jgi:methylenetetrahydrofolate dehydrogenase (NADP+)/methenyltetrahydrofolate cyclohydrolase